MSSVVTNFGSDIALGFGPSEIGLTLADSVGWVDSVYALPSTFDFQWTVEEALVMSDDFISVGVPVVTSIIVGDALVMTDHLP